MKTVTKKLRSPLKWHGGKSYLARRIVSLFPEHETYVEPFFGGGSVLLNKPRCFMEVVGDLNLDLVLFWKALQDYPNYLESLTREVRYERRSFDAVIAASKFDFIGMDDTQKALAYLVKNRFSRGGMGKDFAWSDRLRGGKPGDANAWDTIRDDLLEIARRINSVKFWRADFIELIRKYSDSPTTLFYCDPPYLHATRTHRKAYAHEMADKDHERLLETLLGCEGRVFVSGYACELYDDMLAGWKRHIFDMPNHSGQGKTKQRRIEVLWENAPVRVASPLDPAPARDPLAGQLSFFDSMEAARS